MFLALTEGDNRNVMAAQLAAEALGIERVVAKINDPVRAEAYAELGHRHDLPDRAHAGRAERLPGLPGVRSRRAPAAVGDAPRRSTITITEAADADGSERPPTPAGRPEPCSSSSSVAGRSATTSPRS